MASKSRRKANKKQSQKKLTPNAVKRGKALKKAQIQRDRIAASNEKNYRKRLRQLKATGLYQPKSTKLTASRKAAINRRYRKFEEFLFGDNYIFVPIPTRSKKKLKTAIKLAKQNQMATAPRGVFIPKTRNTKKAVAVFSKRTKTYRIKVTKKKKGATGSKTVTEIIPLEPMGALEDELDRIEDDADMLDIGKGDTIAFKVEMGGGEGYGHQIFRDPKLLRNYLSSQYHQAMAHKLAFFRAVSVFKTKRDSYFGDHPRPDSNPYKARANAKGRSVLKRGKAKRSKFMTPWEQGYASYNSGFKLTDNPYPMPPERRQWQNGWLQAQKDDTK